MGQDAITNARVYKEHAGTVKIAGVTQPKNAGRCAFNYARRGEESIDFFCIGANANQQATKAMGVFRFMVISANPPLGFSDVAFQPELVSTLTISPADGRELMKSATVWKTVFIINE